MPDIKVKSENKGIKAIDKTATLSERMKTNVIKTKEKAENGYYQDTTHDTPEEYATDDATQKAETAVRDTVYYTKRTVKKQTKKAIEKFRQNRAKKNTTKIGSTELSVRPSTNTAPERTVQNPRLKAPAEKTIKKATKSIKETGKGTIKTAQKSVKTAEKTSKAAIKTTQQAAKAAQKTAQASAKAAQRAAQATRAMAKAAAATAKAAAKAIVATVKAMIAGTKTLIAAIAAGGWIAFVVIVVICLVALIVGSCFGIFFSNEDSGTGQIMQTVIQEINAEYQNNIDEIKRANSYDVLEMSGVSVVWKEVFAVYSVKVNTDPTNPQEVASMDDSKKKILKDVFWDMNTISSSVESKSEIVIETTDDDKGNIVETPIEVTRTYLYIDVSHLTAQEMAVKYGFNADQNEQLTQLLKPEHDDMWASVLYGIEYGNSDIIAVAISQLGNIGIGGQPYWSWYGFACRAEWCCCFVSWCANECGYIDAGVIPMFAACNSQGVPWFQSRGIWQNGNYTPEPGDIIFFDWDKSGDADHVGIVQKIDNGRVYVLEGNSSDTVSRNSYYIASDIIFGYGTPQY